MKRYLVLFLMLAAVCLGTDYYVDPLGTNDGAHGTAVGAGAWLTIDYAIENAATDSAIYIKGGTYNEKVSIAAGNTETLTITGLNGEAVIIKPTTVTLYPFTTAVESDCTGTYTWNGITFDASLSTTAYCFYQVNNKNMVFTNCTFIPSTTTSKVFFSDYAAADSVGKETTFNNCSCTFVGTTNLAFIRWSGKKFTMLGGTVDATLGITSISAKAINIETTIEPDEVDIRNVTVYGNYAGIYVNLAKTVRLINNTSRITTSAAAYATPIQIGYTGNIRHSGIAAGGGNDFILLACNAEIADDYWNGAYVKILSGTGEGQVARIIDYDKTGNGNGEKYAQIDAVWAINPVAADSVYEVYFDVYRYALLKGNKAYNDSTKTGYGILIGQGYTDVDVIQNYSSNLLLETALCIRSINADVIDNTAVGATAFRWQGTGHLTARGNTFIAPSASMYAFSWRVNGTDTSNPPIGTMTVEENILYASGANSYCIYDMILNEHCKARFDYNDYWYKNSAKAGYLQDTDYATLTDVVGKWAAPTGWGSTTLAFTDNDSHSVAIDPQLELQSDGTYIPQNPACYNANGELIYGARGGQTYPYVSRRERNVGGRKMYNK